MFCSTCGSKLLEHSNQCLHCGRIEPTVAGPTVAAPVWSDDRPARPWLPWLVGVVLAAIVASLATLLVWPQPSGPGPTASPSPTRPLHPATVGMIDPLERPPSEGWGLAQAELVPAGFTAVEWVYPGELDDSLRGLGVAIATSPTRSSLQAISLANGAVAWRKVVDGRVACAYDRAGALACFSSQGQLLRLDLKTGNAVVTKSTTVGNPAQVWVAPDGALHVAALAEPTDRPAVRTVGVQVSRVDADGNVLWTQGGSLPAGEGQVPRLTGTPTHVVVASAVVTDGRLSTPSIVLTPKGQRVANVPDGADVTVLPDGRLAVASADRTTFFDGTGKELFAVAGRVALASVRDVAVDQVPVTSVVTPPVQAGGTPQPPQLLRVEASGATPALGKGVPLAVCGGLLITENTVGTPASFASQALTQGAKAWEVNHDGVRVAHACDGKRFIAVTIVGGTPVATAYWLTTGEPAWKVEFKDKDYRGIVPGVGWLVHDKRTDRTAVVRG